jgi:hypothetical protein
MDKGIIEQHHESLSHLVKLTSRGIDFVEVTFSAVTHVFETKLNDCADGAACVFEGHNSPAPKKPPRKTA